MEHHHSLIVTCVSIPLNYHLPHITPQLTPGVCGPACLNVANCEVCEGGLQASSLLTGSPARFCTKPFLQVLELGDWYTPATSTLTLLGPLRPTLLS